MLLTFVMNLVLFGPIFETPINKEEALAQGIIFYKEGKILITEKFINVEFLVPFPQYYFTVRQQVETLLHELSTKWVSQSAFYNNTYSTTYINKTDVFNVDWLYAKVLNGTVEAEIEVLKLRNETENLLTRVEEDPRNRQKRAAPCNSSSGRRNWILRPRNRYEQRRIRWNYRNFRLLPTNVPKRQKYRPIG